MGSQYNEFVERQGQSPVLVQKWFANRVLKCVSSSTDIPFPDMYILEVGTGLGYLAQAARTLGAASYMGLEPNEDLRRISEEAASPYYVTSGQLPAIPESLKGKYNLAILVHVLEHAKDGHEARTWLSALLKHLSPGGAVVIISPDVLDYGPYFWDTDWTHGFPTSNRNVAQVFADIDADVTFSQRMRLGRVDPFSSSLGWWFSKLFPTRLANVVGRKIFGRDVGTGLQVAALWSLTFVVGRPNQDRSAS